MKKLLAAAAIVVASFFPAVNDTVSATSFSCSSSGHSSTCHKSDNQSNFRFTHHDRCRGAYGDFSVYGTWKVLYTWNTTAYGPGCPPKTSTLYHGGIVQAI